MDPLTWVYLALLAAGTAAQDQAVRKVDRETAKAQSENRDIRDKREKASKALAADSEQAVLATKDKQAQRAQQLAADYERPQENYDASGRSSVSGLLDPMMAGASASTIENANRLAAKNKREGDFNAQLRGNMGAYDSVMQDAGMTLGNNAADVRRNEKSMNDWTNYVLPMKLAAASQSGRDWSTTGDILKLAAMVTSFGAMANPSAAAPGAQSTVEANNIGAQIQASKLPAGLRGGFTDGYGVPVTGSVPFGSSVGLPEAEAGYLQSLGMDVPDAVSGAFKGFDASRVVRPLSSGFVQPTTAGGAPIDPYGLTRNGMFDPNFWQRIRKPSPIMY